jgi:hypothetical protein
MKTLAAKISRIYGQVTAQEKAGFNQHSKYNYFSEAQLQSYLRPLIASEGIAIFHSTDKITITPIQGDKLKIHSTVETTHTIVDSETGETFVCRSVGEGLDTGDKATYKAITGAVKYFYMKTFGVSDFQDPENDGHVEAPKERTVVLEKQPEPKKEEPKEKDFYRKTLLKLSETECVPEGYIIGGCKATNWIDGNVKSIMDMPEDKAKALIGHMPRIKAKFLENNK